MRYVIGIDIGTCGMKTIPDISRISQINFIYQEI